MRLVIWHSAVLPALILVHSSALATTLQGRLRVQHSDGLSQNQSSLNALQHRLLLNQQFKPGLNTDLQLEWIAAFDSATKDAAVSLEHNRFDLHQLQLTQRWQHYSLTAGRQIWSVGSQRLLGKREGSNVRRRFDGIKLQRHLTDGAALQLYHGYAVTEATGVLDDQTEPQLQLSGMHWQHRQGLWHLMHYVDRRGMTTNYRTSLEAEHSVTANGLTLFMQTAVQSGRHQANQVAASFSQLQLSRRHDMFELSLSASYASAGVGNNGAGFYSPFAKAPYYSAAGYIAPGNLKHFGAGVALRVSEQLAFSANAKRLFIVSKNDALYATGQRVLLASEQIIQSPVADTLDVSFTFAFNARWQLEWLGSYVKPRRAVALQPGTFAEAVLHYRF